MLTCANTYKLYDDYKKTKLNQSVVRFHTLVNNIFRLKMRKFTIALHENKNVL